MDFLFGLGCATSPKMYQKANPGAKTIQDSPNLHQPCPKQLKNHSPDLRKSSKSDRLLLVFILFAIPTHPQKETRKSFQNSSQIVPKEAKKRPSWSSWQHLGDSWAQLAANLIPTWFILLHLAAKLSRKFQPNRSPDPQEPTRPSDQDFP